MFHDIGADDEVAAKVGGGTWAASVSTIGICVDNEVADATLKVEGSNWAACVDTGGIDADGQVAAATVEVEGCIWAASDGTIGIACHAADDTAEASSTSLPAVWVEDQSSLTKTVTG